MRIDCLLTILLSIFLSSFSFGQGQESHLSIQKEAKHYQCGLDINKDLDFGIQEELDERWQSERAYYLDVVKGIQRDFSRNINDIRMVPIQLHVIRTDAGTGGISPIAYESALALANESFIKGGIYLYQCSAINYIDDNTYYDFDRVEANSLQAAHGVTNVLNIYSTNAVTDNGDGTCGYAQFPGGLDFVILANYCTQNGSTFAHEVGHYFNLYHTHTGFMGDELVNGSNCGTAGDLICDTPADPKLDNGVNMNNDGCIYTGSETDANGDPYSPSVTNIMSYTPKECRIQFTDEQYARMLASIDNDRAYLTCSQVLSADFHSFPDYSHCSNTMDADFCNVSTGNITSYLWDFGDGNTSTSEAPTHTYTTAGSYDVQLTVDDGSGTNVEVKTQEIAVGAVEMPYTQDFEAGATALDRFRDSDTYKNYIAVNAAASHASTNGLAFYGFGTGPSTSSPFFQSPTSSNPFGDLWNPYFKSTAYLCVDGSSYTDITLDFDIKQLYRYESYYSNFRVTINGVEVALYQANGSENWTTKSLDLSAFDGTVFTIGFEGSHKYGISDNTTFIDNISIDGNLVVLGVELVDFAAKGTDEMTSLLTWNTAFESDNKGFEIQRSFDGRNWINIGFVEGKEASNTHQFYSFEDKAAQKGVNYYRLKQIDFNNQSTLSEIKTVRFVNGEVSLFPNPTKEALNLRFDDLQADNVHIRIMDITGKELFNGQFIVRNNAVGLNLSDINITQPGAYFIEVHGDVLDVVSMKFVKI